MCRWLAYIGESRPVEGFVYDGPRSLCSQAQQSHKAKLGVHGDGGGLGWYGAPEEPGLYRNAGPAWADPNLREIARMVESRVFFAHVRASTGAPNLEINCHPFRSGRLLFMHNGQIGGFRRLRRRLTEALSDECYDAILGGTDSELLFQLMITNGLREDAPAAIRRTVAEVDGLRRREDIAEPFRATLAVTDGGRLWALRWASDRFAPSLYLTRRDGGALVVSEPLDEDIASWREVPPDSLVSVDAGAGGVSIDLTPSFTASSAS